MIHLTPSSASNDVYVSPFQSRKFLASFTHYLVELLNNASRETFYFIADVTVDNDRYSKFILPTDTDDPTAGSILLTQSGLYTYKIWGQNSASNLDPTDASVVGICEVGSCKVSDEPAWTIPNVTIPDNVIYYE
jgi:hypothetical protein